MTNPAISPQIPVRPPRSPESLLHLLDEDAEEMMIAVRDAGLTIDRAHERPGTAVWQNNGVAAHQAVPHLSFHVAGTLPGGGTDFGTVPELPVEQTDAIARRLAPFVPDRRSSQRRLDTRFDNTAT